MPTKGSRAAKSDSFNNIGTGAAMGHAAIGAHATVAAPVEETAPAVEAVTPLEAPGVVTVPIILAPGPVVVTGLSPVAVTTPAVQGVIASTGTAMLPVCLQRQELLLQRLALPRLQLALGREADALLQRWRQMQDLPISRQLLELNKDKDA
ncbi:hypothetical protein cyc_07418 [Cyclospora cayetanensis]|uniref:Uncharacterized protein n=1 Tax=Cyclospora cayetanensis TaxID=88456 RepID=A0A1D3CTQ0_9EIME|nr:hypothetical protein cyc_07418 [Cyclospora cayetanensis]